MDIIPVENEDYKTYEDLLLRRDACRKDAGQAQTWYIREFGCLLTESFQKQVDCIAKKKAIAYYQAAANRGEQVKMDELNTYLARTMEEYDRQLKDMLAEYEASRKAKEVPQNVVMQVKSLYKKIAKRIHPDMRPDLAGKAVFDDLWEQVTDAYRRNDLEALEELEVLVSEALEENGDASARIKIPDLAEKIEKVQQEIERIISTDPYLYRDLMHNPEAVEEKKEELQDEIQNYVDYGKQLDQVLQEFLEGGVILSWPMK